MSSTDDIKKALTPTPAPVVTPEVKERIDLATAGQEAAKVAAPAIPAAAAADLEDLIRKVLAENKVPATAAPKEPNWATLTEQEAFGADAPYIPVIDHEIPDYLNLKLANTEFVVVWASKNKVRFSQLQAEGYELLKLEHIAKGSPMRLQPTTEGTFEYEDVIAMRVHKRIKFGKQKKFEGISHAQLKPLMMQQKAMADIEKNAIGEDPQLGRAFQSGGMGFFNTNEA